MFMLLINQKYVHVLNNQKYVHVVNQSKNMFMLLNNQKYVHFKRFISIIKICTILLNILNKRHKRLIILTNKTTILFSKLINYQKTFS